MMKKFFLLLLAAAAFAACDDDKDYGLPTEDYTGTLTVTSLSDPAQVNTFQNKHFSLTGNENGTLTLWMHETQFVPQMPELTMAVPDIPYTLTGDRLTLAAERIVPKMGGRPYDKYAITNLTGTVIEAEPEDRLEVNFDCMGFRVVYTGIETD